MTKIEIVKGDITKQTVDAIVNAANRTLLGGAGVDGSIHRAAGPELLEECRGLRGCETGEAKITRAYNLPARFVIHTVGPVYGNEHGKEAELLASCYRKSLGIAKAYALKTIAFPSISTGAYGYPIQEASLIATNIVKNVLESGLISIDRVVFVTFSVADHRAYLDAYRTTFGSKR